MKRAREREKNVLMLQSESVIKSVGALFKKIVICTAFSTVLYVVVDILVPEVVQTLTQNRFIYICEHTWKMMILFSWHLIFFLCCSALIDQWVVFATVISECWMWGVKRVFEEFKCFIDTEFNVGTRIFSNPSISMNLNWIFTHRNWKSSLISNICILMLSYDEHFSFNNHDQSLLTPLWSYFDRLKCNEVSFLYVSHDRFVVVL